MNRDMESHAKMDTQAIKEPYFDDGLEDICFKLQFLCRTLLNVSQIAQVMQDNCGHCLDFHKIYNMTAVWCIYCLKKYEKE